MKRIYADMVGDLFHIGHINMFKQARKFGDYLIVGIHSDETVKLYKEAPFFLEEERYEIIKNCKLVDEIIEDAPLIITKEYLLKHDISLVVHGDDARSVYDSFYKIPIDMGIMRYIKYTEGTSTTKIKNEICKHLKD